MARTPLWSALLVVALGVRSSPQQALMQESSGDGDDDSASSKMNEIWNKVVSDNNEPGKMPSALAPLKLMAGHLPFVGWLLKWIPGMQEDLTLTFSWRSDQEMPKGHTKLIHPVGSVAKVKLVWDKEAIQEAGYTGLFKVDQDEALIRIGPAGALKDEGMAPGVALKVFRNYADSVNTFMLYSLRGQKNFSQFEHTLCNKLSDFRDKIKPEQWLLSAFRTASKYPFTTGLSEWAEEVPEVKKNFPFVLCLRPVDSVREQFQEFNSVKFDHIQDQLGVLNARTNIYEIYAAPEPKMTPTKIGVIQLRTKFRKSKYGDTQLFFRHAPFETDLEEKPAWVPIVDEEDFWYEEGANNRYSEIDPGMVDEGIGGNAWVGGYSPESQEQIQEDAKELNKGWWGGSLFQTREQTRPRCPFAYLHQGQDSMVHALVK